MAVGGRWERWPGGRGDGGEEYSPELSKDQTTARREVMIRTVKGSRSAAHRT